MTATPAPECQCDACRVLAAEYENDPGLLRFYRKKLLIRGWAGRTTPTEKAYILAHAPWAQHAAEVGRRNLAHLSNAHTQTRLGAGVVVEDVSPETDRCSALTMAREVVSIVLEPAP